MAEGLPTEQAVRPRRTLRSRKAVYLAGIVFALRPAGGKLHDCRCGQGVGEMPMPACQRAGMFSAVTAAPVGIVAGRLTNQLCEYIPNCLSLMYNQKVSQSGSPPVSHCRFQYGSEHLADSQ